MRRTKGIQNYKKTGNLRAAQLLPGTRKYTALSDTSNSGLRMLLRSQQLLKSEEKAAFGDGPILPLNQQIEVAPTRSAFFAWHI